MQATSRRAIALIAMLMLIAAACGGGGDESSGDDDGAVVAGGQGGQQVIDTDALADARAEAEEAAEQEAEGDAPAVLSADDVQSEELGNDAPADDAEDGATDEAGEDEIEVTTADEDPLDGLLNAVTEFQNCITDQGFEFIGAPGQDGATVEDFDQDYMAALGTCASQTDILAAFEEFGASQENLTPEQIAQTNFGLPVFKECMERLGWTVEDLVPDERGALGFGTSGTGLTPPEDSDATILDTDDINECRQEAEAYTEANFVAEEG